MSKVPYQRHESTNRYKVSYPMVAISFFVGILIGYERNSFSLTSNIRYENTEKKDNIGMAMYSDPRETTKEYVPTTIIELIGALSLEERKLRDKIKVEYGDYNDLLFDKSIHPEIIVMNNISRERLKRRMMIKILQSLSKENEPNKYEDDGNLREQDITFTWVTGGDSSAAGHGNLLEQSYTAVLEDTVKDVFASLGIKFIARNYAMGGYVSAPELALCMESIYGSDIDVLNWDFAKMDGTNHHRAALWGSRAGVHPSKPILFMMDDLSSKRFETFLYLEKNGLGVALMNGNAYKHLRKRMPDSNDNFIEVDEIPDALRYFICGETIEGSASCEDSMRFNACETEEGLLCKQNKWRTKDKCIDARYQTSWHPGWKEHLLRGRLLGYFLSNMLFEAVIDLRDLQYKFNNNIDILNFLFVQDGADVAQYLSSPPDVGIWQVDAETFMNVNGNRLFRSQVICHSALLPSRARIDGLVTDSFLTDSRRNADEFGGFDIGLNMHLMSTPDDGKSPLSFDPNDRQRCDALEIDHKDFFYIREGDGWLSLNVPTNSELEVLGKSKPSFSHEKRHDGLILVCLKICPLGRCPDAAIGFGTLRRNRRLFVTVDGKPVETVKRLEGCHFLAGKEGINWGPGAKMDGNQYELKLKVDDPGTGHWCRISSVILF